MELFAKIVNGLKQLTIFAKSSILGVQPVSEYASAKLNFKHSQATLKEL